VTAQEVVLKPGDIAKRTKLEKSLMPDGLAAGMSVTDLPPWWTTSKASRTGGSDPLNDGSACLSHLKRQLRCVARSEWIAGEIAGL
jgi:hypothetical protein